ncbi:MAG: glycosyltransferase [Geitlerinemataceae cyanobacterium]
MSRIVIATWGSLGDLHPAIALGLGLRDRGHHITIASVERYRPKVAALGLTFHAIRPELPEEPETISRIMNPQTGAEAVLKDLIIGNLRETVADLTAIAKDADFLIAHEVVYAAPIVAEVQKLPWASFTLSPQTFFSVYEPFVNAAQPFLAEFHRFGPTVNSLAINAIKFVTSLWTKPVYVLRRELGLPKISHPIVGNDKYSPHLVLALFSSAIADPQPDWPPNTVTAGFTFYDGSSKKMPPELEAFLEAGEPPLVFTLGSAAVKAPGEFYADSAKAAIALRRRAVLVLGDNPVPADLPESILACEYAPYSALFPRALAIVHQGGIGTTAQGLKSGRPTAIVPYTLDQPDNASRAECLGTSRTIARKRYSAARATEVLRELIENPSYAEKAAEVEAVLQAEDGVAVACDAIERQLDRAN